MQSLTAQIIQCNQYNNQSPAVRDTQ